MNPSVQIRDIAVRLRDLRLNHEAAMLEAIATHVARMERTLDEIVADAIEDEQLRAAAVETAVVVKFPAWRL